MTKFRVPGPKRRIPVVLAVEQVDVLDRYAQASGLSRNELIRRAVALFINELEADQVALEEYYERRGTLPGGDDLEDFGDPGLARCHRPYALNFGMAEPKRARMAL